MSCILKLIDHFISRDGLESQSGQDQSRQFTETVLADTFADLELRQELDELNQAISINSGDVSTQFRIFLLNQCIPLARSGKERKFGTSANPKLSSAAWRVWTGVGGSYLTLI
jgi:hypothetical protein